MVSQAIAQVARPVRWASLGTSRRNDSSSAERRSGASARVSGTGAGGGEVGQQRHGQRVPAAQRDQVRPVRRYDAGVGEQLAALDVVEGVEAVHG